MSSDRELLTALEDEIRKHAPKFEIRFKNESKLMRFIGKILFFNKTFMTNYTTVLGPKVYFPTKEYYESNPVGSFDTLSHEFVHIMDDNRHPFLFKLKFAFPQILAVLGVLSLILIPLACLSVISSWWLMLLAFLVF